jgi:hypothetical protein
LSTTLLALDLDVLAADERARLVDQLAALIEEDESGCWLWRGRIDRPDGFPLFPFGEGLRSAARVVFGLEVAPVPAGVHVRRVCGRSLCVRPDHLILGRARQKAPPEPRPRPTRCHRGHDLTDPANVLLVRGGRSRHCRACARIRARRRRARLRDERAA